MKYMKFTYDGDGIILSVNIPGLENADHWFGF
jgi:hypothetical protein